MTNTTAGERTLFVPLKGEWFDKFESGEKTIEYRAYGPRWNERTCRPGRAVTLSRGYSGRRLHGYVTWHKVLEPSKAPPEARFIYPDATFIMSFGVDLSPYRP